MKKSAVVMMVLLVTVGSLVWAQSQSCSSKACSTAQTCCKSKACSQQVGWFDAGACDICKPMHAHPELMTSMKWETHKIKNGMLMVATIPAEHQKKFARLCAKIHKQGEELVASGAALSLCGFCDSYGKLKQVGAQEEKIKTDFGSITILSAKDATVVKRIHTHAERCQEESKKLALAMEQ